MPSAELKKVFPSLPGTPLPDAQEGAHLGSSVTGLFSVVLPDWSFVNPSPKAALQKLGDQSPSAYCQSCFVNM
jgi:hypothetical protein